MNTNTLPLKRATRDEARTAWSRLNAKQRGSVVGRTFDAIIGLLDDDGTAMLGPLLDALFADRDLRAAHTALKTQFIARPPLDEAGLPLIQLCLSALPKLRGADEDERLRALRAARAWFDIPDRLKPEACAFTVTDDVAKHLVPAVPAMDRSSEEDLAWSKSNALRAAEIAQVASARSDSLFHGNQSIRGLGRTGPFLLSQGVDAPMMKPNRHAGKKREEDRAEFDDSDIVNDIAEDAAAAEPATADDPHQVIALSTLLKWAGNTSPDAPRLYALLGDSGTGKTTNAQEFTRVLNGESSHADWPPKDAAIEKAPAHPKALFFDLADLSGVPNLEQLSLEEMLVLLLKRRDGVRVQVVADVAPLLADARAGRIIFVFDGLDELLKTDPLVLQKVFEQLIKVVERPRVASTSASTAQRPPKVIVSCRTHYFRDVEAQHSFFLARGRGAVKATDYRVLTLLPWNAELIERYLASHVGATEAARLLRLIEGTYNLSELASRPFLLAMMCGTLEQLLARADQGERIDAAALYSETVAAWIHRDAGKHRLSAAQKPLLMGALATAMWNDGSELWPVDRLDQWVLHTVRTLFPEQYSPAELRGVQDDLRTATFIVRPDAQQFNFAHRSYGEYFTARFLLDGMSQVADGFWSLATLRAYSPTRPLGRETHNFLIEMWRSDQRALPAQTLKRRIDVLRQLLQGGDAAPAPPLHATLWHLLRDTRLPLAGTGKAGNASADAINLRGLDFSDERWEDLDLTALPPLDLRGASLRGLYAINCRFGTVRSDAHTNWSQAVLRGCNTSLIDWSTSMRGRLIVRAAAPRRGTASAKPLRGPWALPRVVTAFNCVAFSPDGKTLASGSGDNTVRLWDLNTGGELRVLSGHGNWVTSVAFSPDGKTLASGSDDNTVRLWDLNTGGELRVLSGHGSWVRSVAFSPDGKTLASGSDDNTVRLWDLNTGGELRVLSGHGNWVTSVAFSPDGKTLASGSDDNTVRLWDLNTGGELRVLSGHGNTVRSVAFSPDGKTLASGSGDNTVRLWDLNTGGELRVLSGHGNWVTSVAFSPDGKTLASGSDDNTVRLWDLNTGGELRVLSGHGNWVTSVAFSPDGKTLASGSDDNTVRLWDLNTGGELRVLSGHGNWVTSVAFSPDGKTLASGSDDNTVRLWDLNTGGELRVLSGHGNTVRSVAFSPDGKTLASGSDDNTVRLWDLNTGGELRVLSGHGNWVTSVAFSPDGKTLASGSGDNTVRLWDLNTGGELRVLSGHGNWVTSVAFSPDGKTLASGSDDNTVRLWDLNTGGELRVLSGHGNTVRSVAFSPDGKTLASGSDDNTVRLWDLNTGGELRVLSGHGSWVRSVAFSPDGKTLASGSGDNTVRLWDLNTGGELRVLSGHGNWVTSVAFSPDGKTLASGSGDSTMRVWQLREARAGDAAVCRVMLAHPRAPVLPGWSDFTEDGALVDWSDCAPDHWLFYLGRGRSEPLEAAL